MSTKDLLQASQDGQSLSFKDQQHWFCHIKNDVDGGVLLGRLGIEMSLKRNQVEALSEALQLWLETSSFVS